MSGVDHRGYTLIEVVVSLTIITIVLAVAIPTLNGLHRDEAARAPIKALEEIVQEARHRAIREGFPYQIVFEREGIHASPETFAFPKARRIFSRSSKRCARRRKRRRSSASSSSRSSCSARKW